MLLSPFLCAVADMAVHCSLWPPLQFVRRLDDWQTRLCSGEHHGAHLQGSGSHEPMVANLRSSLTVCWSVEKNCGNYLLFGRLSLNSPSVCAISVQGEPNLHVDLPAICHIHEYDLMWFGHRDTVVYGNAGGNWSANWIEL